MSKHWTPEEEIARQVRADAVAPPAKPAWPKGATAGLLLVAACCLAVGAMVYQIAGPRDPIDDSVASGDDVAARRGR